MIQHSNIFRKEILEIIYQKFHAVEFTVTDVKKKVCYPYSISESVVERYLRYLLVKKYIRVVDVRCGRRRRLLASRGF